jgi:hypothetical protein
MGSFPLLGLDRAAWDVDHEEDLIALNARQAPDLFSRWFTDKAMPAYHDIIGEKFKVCVYLLYFLFLFASAK